MTKEKMKVRSQLTLRLMGRELTKVISGLVTPLSVPGPYYLTFHPQT